MGHFVLQNFGMLTGFGIMLLIAIFEDHIVIDFGFQLEFVMGGVIQLHSHSCFALKWLCGTVFHACLRRQHQQLTVDMDMQKKTCLHFIFSSPPLQATQNGYLLSSSSFVDLASSSVFFFFFLSMYAQSDIHSTQEALPSIWVIPLILQFFSFFLGLCPREKQLFISHPFSVMFGSFIHLYWNSQSIHS